MMLLLTALSDLIQGEGRPGMLLCMPKLALVRRCRSFRPGKLSKLARSISQKILEVA